MQQKVTTQKINGFVTKRCNEGILTDKQRYFIGKAKRINVEKHRPFSCYDFPELSSVNFRQMIYRLKGHIELYTKSTPCFYKVKGIKIHLSDTIVTEKPTGEAMYDILLHVRQQPPAIHDIKLQFPSDLHGIYSKKPFCKMNPKNKCIIEKIPGLSPNIFAKLLIYPSMIQVDIACTNSPLIYDVNGALKLVCFLGRLYQYLWFLGDFQAEIPEIWDWVVTQYHFGKDGTEELNGKMFHRTIEEFSTGLVRFYSKRMPDGKTIARFEVTQNPKNSLDKEIDKMIATSL